MSEITAVPLRPVGKSGITALWIGVAILIVAGVGGAYASTHDAVISAMPPEQFLAENAKRMGVKRTASGLEYQILKAGSGATPTSSDVAQLDYKGRLLNGTQFDASKPGQPAVLPIGQVVPGFAEALTLMPKGSTYRFWIPPQLAYGDREAGPIPPNSVLVFDITLHDFMAMPQGMPAGMGAQPGQ